MNFAGYNTQRLDFYFIKIFEIIFTKINIKFCSNVLTKKSQLTVFGVRSEIQITQIPKKGVPYHMESALQYSLSIYDCHTIPSVKYRITYGNKKVGQ